MAHRRRQPSRTGGFTLIEILVALAVTSVAITIFVQCFSFSLALARSGRNENIAAALAEEHLQALLRSPERYDWHADHAAPGQLVEVTMAGEVQQKAASGQPPNPKQADVIRPCMPPEVLPVNPRASSREEAMYRAFSWQAFQKVSGPDASHVEITVVVRWMDAGRSQLFALTSLAPRLLLTRGAARARTEGST